MAAPGSYAEFSDASSVPDLTIVASEPPKPRDTPKPREPRGPGPTKGDKMCLLLIFTFVWCVGGAWAFAGMLSPLFPLGPKTEHITCTIDIYPDAEATGVCTNVTYVLHAGKCVSRLTACFGAAQLNWTQVPCYRRGCVLRLGDIGPSSHNKRAALGVGFGCAAAVTVCMYVLCCGVYLFLRRSPQWNEPLPIRERDTVVIRGNNLSVHRV